MLGAIIGDVVGSRFEFNNYRSKKFKLFDKQSTFTDDTVLSFAVLKTLFNFLNEGRRATCYDDLKKYQVDLVNNLKDFTYRYPDRSYGIAYEKWAKSKSNMPYYSYGNGSAMRITPIPFMLSRFNEVKIMAKVTSEVTHNHPLGIKGAEALASATFLAKAGKSKMIIKDYIYNNYYPIINYLDYDELVKNNKFNEACEDTVPKAIYCFLISNSLEDTIRTAVSIGGDSDTIACMAAMVADGYYYYDRETASLKRHFLSERILPDEFLKLYKQPNINIGRRTII